MIHFNTAGSGLMSRETLDRMQRYLQEEFELGAYETELNHSPVLDVEVYENIARLLGAEARNIALFDGATKAWVTALESLTWTEGARVLVTPYEYAGNLIALSTLQRLHGVVVEVMPLLADGNLDLQWLARNMSAEVKLVSLVHVPSCCGIVNDIVAVGNILRDYPGLYFVDACQSAGMLALDVRAIGCDVLTAAGRKFLCGPRGTGFAYLSERFMACAQPRFTDLGRAGVDLSGVVHRRLDDARGFEFAERNNAAVVGLNRAIKERLSSAYGEESELYRTLFQRLARMPDVHLIAPGTHHQGIIAFTHARCAATEVVGYLRARGVNCWPGYASHTPYFMLKQGHERFVRISINARNTVREADEFISLLEQI
ncbi:MULTISPECIES: aminotransferase class V-fold PLP-dependent enzyme [unclassified Pseudomonas]|uniref:aminotransferase class V-fold PLP-dependent enzyme n=1 Tax=unclassified Pseudomonas TaxID=196821 RepID=UPI00119EABDB|nr:MULTISPECIES: aminotransferase class V-fold PLP-dependent enzyme [unclassified Pseudomonas]TWC11371.1 selenocysteine lyase/cysteine desulfurase [Pseudomonas sp. SJZ075]TWC28073.1 selenocysteine lyase/cysteine desulfurase [Pseudomonas sp. SJZ078]TWC47744.1 selenocysteine lyase/cysteine desulfurase [Pseudomonas sp. SJZ124]TWC83196.1 selenocysteine lyase/cysteine desulfurase [Pseudomonas sp. SJZ101]